MGTDTALRESRRYNLNIAQIEAWYEEGATLTEISRRLGVSLSVVRKRMMAAGVPRRKKGPKPGAQWPRPKRPFKPTRHQLDMDQIRTWYAEGASIREIGLRLGGVPKKTVHRHMIAAGIPRREPGPVVPVNHKPLGDEEKEAILVAREAGVPVREIARQFGRSEGTVHRLRRPGPHVDRRKRPQAVAQVRELHAQGLRGTQISRALGWSDSRASKIQQRLGLDPRPPLPPPSQVVELYRELGEVKAVAAHLRKSRDFVRRILRDEGIEIRKPSPLEKHADAIRRAYLEEGLTIAELGGRYGVPYPTMHGFLDRRGIALFRHVTARQHEQMVQMAAAGVPVREIARQFGVTDITVSKHLMDQPNRRFASERGGAQTTP